MAGSVVRCTHEDSVKITRPDGTSLQLPAAFVLAIDKVLRHVLAEDGAFDIQPVMDDGTGEEGFQAEAEGTFSDICATPWAALLDLAGRLP